MSLIGSRYYNFSGVRGSWRGSEYGNVKANGDGSYVTDLTCPQWGDISRRDLATGGTWMTCPKCGPADGVLDVGYDLAT